jgi:cysteine desulfurase
MRRIYLDHNASTPVDPRVRDAILPWLGDAAGNPGSLHAEGRAARRAVEDAREEAARLVGGDAREIVFTSGATEAVATALRGAAAARPTPGRLVVSAVEHACVLETAAVLAREGWTIDELPVDRSGVIDLAALDRLLTRPCDGVVAMAANNESGAVQPLAEIDRRCAAAGVPLHVDAAQAPGKIRFDAASLRALTSAVLSAHKCGGPKGVGALWIRRETKLRPLFVGGGQERDRRAGTENVPGIVGFGVAARLAREELEVRRRALLAAEDAFLDATGGRRRRFRTPRARRAGASAPGDPFAPLPRSVGRGDGVGARSPGGRRGTRGGLLQRSGASEPCVEGDGIGEGGVFGDDPRVVRLGHVAGRGVRGSGSDHRVPRDFPLSRRRPRGRHHGLILKRNESLSYDHSEVCFPVRFCSASDDAAAN